MYIGWKSKSGVFLFVIFIMFSFVLIACNDDDEKNDSETETENISVPTQENNSETETENISVPTQENDSETETETENSSVPAQNVRLADRDSDYTDFGLTKGTIELWEDGLRLDVNSENIGFEWWYFDGMFDDGSSFVISYYSKIDTDLTKPYIRLNITTPEGENLSRTMWGEHANSSFSTDSCDFHIGENNRVSSDDGTTYDIQARIDDDGTILAVDLELVRNAKSFRQATGHILVGDDEEKYLGWFSMVPRGTLNGTITYNGETHTVTGTGYHDHNWGTIPLQNCIKDWWWMRGYADDIAIIAYNFSFNDTYGAKQIPIYGIMNSTEVLAEYNSSMNFSMSGSNWDYPDDPEYIADDPTDRIPFEIIIQAGDCDQGSSCIQNKFSSIDLIESTDLLLLQNMPESTIDQLHSSGFDPWYTRYTGSVSISAENDNGWNTSGSVSGSAIIEYLDLH